MENACSQAAGHTPADPNQPEVVGSWCGTTYLSNGFLMMAYTDCTHPSTRTAMTPCTGSYMAVVQRCVDGGVWVASVRVAPTASINVTGNCAAVHIHVVMDAKRVARTHARWYVFVLSVLLFSVHPADTL
jgi:hypothetical protein